MTLSLTTDAAAYDDREAVEFTIDGERFGYLPPKDSVLALGMLLPDRDRSDGTLGSALAAAGVSTTAIKQARDVFEGIRVGLDAYDRRLGRRIDPDGTPADRPLPGSDEVDPGPTQWERIIGRLSDPADPLDLVPTARLFADVIAAGRSAGDTAGRPPTSSTG